MTILEEMAIAVLKGDLVAARALADTLREEHSAGMMELPPVKKIKCDVEKLRMLIISRPDTEVDQESLSHMQGEIELWIQGVGIGGKGLVLTGVESVQIYEMP